MANTLQLFNQLSQRLREINADLSLPQQFGINRTTLLKEKKLINNLISFYTAPLKKKE